jgi:HPt (histidine-containing phosphotransfer) domain-containing protein
VHPLVAAAAAAWGVAPEIVAREMGGAARRLSAREAARFALDYYRGRALPPGYSFYSRHGCEPAVIWRKPARPVVREVVSVVEGERRRPDFAWKTAAPALGLLVQSGAQLWNDEILRLHAMEFAEDAARAEFSRGRFYDYRFSTGLLGEEAALGRTALRDALMPAMAGFSERFTAGGMQALVAVARPAPDNDFALFLQVRSGRVSDAHGLHGVIPMAYHQAMGDDARALETALREVAEELCGVEEGAAYRESPAIAALEREAVREITGFTLNLVNGNYDYNILICHAEPSYWENYARHWRSNWEAERTLVLSSRDHGTFHRLISQEDWVPQSLTALLEGMDRLRAIDPRRLDP